MPTATIVMPARSKIAEQSSFIRPLEGSAIVMVIRRPSRVSIRSSQSAKPTAGIWSFGAEQRQQPVETAAAGEHRRRSFHRHLEDEAGVIVERTAEGGAIVDLRCIDTGIGKSCDAGVETLRAQSPASTRPHRQSRLAQKTRRRAAGSATGTLPGHRKPHHRGGFPTGPAFR